MWLFFVSRKNKDIHNCLRHYQQGSNLTFENRLIKIVRFDGISTCLISFERHEKLYSFFFNSGDTIENLLNVFRHRFIPNDEKVLIKFTFSVVSFQPSPAPGLAKITDTRIWSTKVYSCVFH